MSRLFLITMNDQPVRMRNILHSSKMTKTIETMLKIRCCKTWVDCCCERTMWITVLFAYYNLLKRYGRQWVCVHVTFFHQWKVLMASSKSIHLNRIFGICFRITNWLKKYYFEFFIGISSMYWLLSLATYF